MSSSSQLYNHLFPKLRAWHPAPHRKHIANFVWIIVGILQSQSIQLSQIAQTLPHATHAAARLALVRRWLANPAIDVEALYQPLIRHVLLGWRGYHVTIILDGSHVNRHLQLFRVALSHGRRALPLAWLVRPSKGLIQVEPCQPLLLRVAHLLHGTRSVTFLADRGFRDRDWAAQCQALGWDYSIRLANNTTVTLSTGHHAALQSFAPAHGRCRYLQNVRLTVEADWTCNIALTWTRATPKSPPELCAVMSNRRAHISVLRHYLRRMHIEQSFRDEKSGSFDIEASQLRHADRLHRLLLAVAVAVLWIYELAEEVVRTDTRREVDPAHQRQLSLFQLGWRRLQRILRCGFPLPPFTLALRFFSLPPIVRPRKC